jgi:NAD(P)-dependent dehydrogenase (short-subunit alcohol dehydrogenase family)
VRDVILEGKVAVITGGGSGIGEATVLKFAKEGAKVVVLDIVEDAGNKVVEEVKKTGGEAMFVKADICDIAQVETAVKKAVDGFGRLDILINNAGINKDALLKKMTVEQWDKVLSVNLKGTFVCSKVAAAPMMEQKSGCINTTASIGALGNIGQANYAASKAGVIGLTKTLALELARYKIRVNCVSPGATNTPMTAGMPEDIAEMFRKKIPLRRFAEPSEIAAVHCFLASDDADYVTGQVLFVDGGISVGL